MANNLNHVSARTPTRMGGSSSFAGPSEEWLCRTWTVTHSTHKAYAGCRNCRISYSTAGEGGSRLTSTSKVERRGAVKTWTASWKASGKEGEWEASRHWPLLRRASSSFSSPAAPVTSSRWEILGWGDIREDEGKKHATASESWMIVLYDSGVVDVLSSRPQGMGSFTADRCLSALKRLPDSAAKIRNAIVMNLKVVDVVLPRKE